MLWITSLFLLLSLQATSGTKLEDVTVEPGTCPPDCSAATSDSPRVPDPENCHRYYVCIGGGAFGPYYCPDGTYFDVNKADCMPNGPEECRPSCGGGGGVCTYECGAGITYTADRYDCSSYYVCADNSWMHCSQETPYFDGEKCQTEEKHCCHCKPFCYTGDKGKLVADPTDCTKFYICTEENAIPDVSKQCPSGENFDPLSNDCSPSAPCLTFCPSVERP